MSSVLKTAWRVVVRRAIADRAILAAGFSTILLAIALISVGPIYADAVTVSSLRRTLIDSPVTEANIAITTRVDPDNFASTDDQVFGAINDVFEGIGGSVFRRGTSDSFSIQGLPGDHANGLIVFRFFSEIESRVDLVSGSWPGGAGRPGGPVSAAIPASTASALGLGLGNTFDAVGRRAGSSSHIIEVAGIYQVKDATDPYWLDDEIDIAGVSSSASFTTYGFLVNSDVFFSEIAPGTSSVRWTAYPDHAEIGVADIGIILSRLDTLDTTLNSTRDVGNQMQIETGLDTILRETQRSLLVTRSAVVILTIQLSVLAAYALILTAGLLSDTREVETTTLRARGAGTSQLLGMSIMEGLLLVIPALVCGPPLAAWLLRIFNRVGPLAGIGLKIDPATTAASWALAGVAAFGCVVAMAVPAYRSARRMGNIRATRSRQSAVGSGRKAGADVALLAVAGLGLWQLAQYGTPITQNVRGRFGIDPLLVATPALALLAGAVLALRALPLIARLADVIVTTGKKLAANLGIWQLSRQSRRYSRSALMLMLSLAVGVFALSYASTWQTSQADRASFTTGADILVSPSRRIAHSLPDQVLSDAYSHLDGVTASVPLVRIPTSLPGSSLPIEYVLVDSLRTSNAVIFRDDQANESIQDLLSQLDSGRPPSSATQLEGRPTAVALTASMTVAPLSDLTYEPFPSDYIFTPSIRIVFSDGDAIPFRVDLGLLDPTGQPVEMTASLVYRAEDGQIFSPVYPLRILGVEIRGLAPFDPFLEQAEITIGGLSFTEDGSSWEPFTLQGSTPMKTSISQVRLAAEEPAIHLRQGPGDAVIADLETGTSLARPTRPPVYYMIWFAPPPDLSRIPVLAPSMLMSELGLAQGDSIPLGGLTGFTGSGVVVGEFKTFPTVDPNARYAVVADYQTYLTATFGPGVFPPEPQDYWLTASATPLADVSRELRNAPYSSSSVISRDEALTRLALDPVSLGTMGSLIMGLAAASILAAIGFMVNVVVSTRERSGQFALMRALGMSARQLLTWVGIENGVTVGFALLFGTGLGLMLANIALPLTSVTQQGTAVVPDLVVVHPWRSIAFLDIGLVLVLAVTVGLVSRMLNRLDLAALLRAGEE